MWKTRQSLYKAVGLALTASFVVAVFASQTDAWDYGESRLYCFRCGGLGRSLERSIHGLMGYLILSRANVLSAPLRSLTTLDVVSAMFISKRTLQRRLDRERTSYRQLLEKLLSGTCVNPV